MTKEELENLLEGLEGAGFNVIAVDVERFNEENPDEDYECFDNYVNELKMKKKFEISKIDFNKACDYVVGCIDDLGFDDIMLLAKFTSAVRYVLFDMASDTKKEDE